MTDRPLSILHLTAGSDAGGLSRYVLDLGTAMAADGHAVAVAGQRGAWHELFAPLAWVDVPLKGGPIDLWRSARTLARHLRDHPADVLHAHYRRAALVGRLVQRWHPVPLLYTLHLSDIPLGFGRRHLSDFGDHTHAASADAADWLTKVARVPAEHITVIPHGVDPARFTVDGPDLRGELGIGPDETVAAFVGRLDDPKNVGWALDVADAMPGVRVVIVGEGPQEAAVRRRIKSDRVTLLAGRRDPAPVYRTADLLLLPSGREGFSLVAAEAMCCGTPVLRTRTAGTTETIVDGITGRSVPIDHDAFVAEAGRLLADRAGLARMGSAAAEHVRRHLPFDRQVADTVALYRRLCDGQRGKNLTRL